MEAANLAKSADLSQFFQFTQLDWLAQAKEQAQPVWRAQTADSTGSSTRADGERRHE
jgi:hypothetical protein